MNKLTQKEPLASFTALLLCLCLAACSRVPTLSPGGTWTVDKTTQTDSITIPDGASIVAPAGKSVTMTVDGVETRQDRVYRHR